MLDLLVALGLTLVVSAMAAPTASKIVSNYQLRAATDQLAMEIGKARIRAVGQGVFSRVRITEGGYVVETSEDGSTYTIVDGPFDLQEGWSISVEGNHPTFSRTGLTAAPASISVGGNSLYRTLHVNVLGRVTAS